MNETNQDEEGTSEGSLAADANPAADADIATDAQSNIAAQVLDAGVSDVSDNSGMTDTIDGRENIDMNDSAGATGTADAGAAGDAGIDVPQAKSEPLTDSYERLRHSTDSAELSEFAHRPLPEKTDQSAFSRSTALLEAVAGNPNTPLEDRIFLGRTMPFPNILVKLSDDESAEVRTAVAANKDDKNWLVGRLTKDADAGVREAALHNPQTSWKMRLEGAQDPRTGVETLDFLAKMGVDSYQDASPVLTRMVRRAVACNPSAGEDTLRRLSVDESDEVAKQARLRLNR